MKVLCSWCLKDGKPEPEALIGEREPLDDKRSSHGICQHHRHEIEERVTRLREEARRQEEIAERQKTAARKQGAAAEELRQKIDP